MLFLIWWEISGLLTRLYNQHSLLFIFTMLHELVFIFLMLCKSCGPSAVWISQNVSRIELHSLLGSTLAHRALRRWNQEVLFIVHYLWELVEVRAWLSQVDTMFDRGLFKVADLVVCFWVGTALANSKHLSCLLLISSYAFFRRKLRER